MKITQDTPDRLVVDHTPWRMLFAVILFFAACLFWAFDQGPEVGAVVALLCLFLAWLASRRLERVRLVLDRTTGQADLRRISRLQGATEVRYALNEISGIDLVTQKSGRTTAHQLDIVISDGPHAGRHPITGTQLVEDRVPEIATRLNDWLNTP